MFTGLNGDYCTPAKSFGRWLHLQKHLKGGGTKTTTTSWWNLHGMKAVEDMACFIYYTSFTREQNNINNYLWNVWPLHLLPCLLLPLQDYSLVRCFLRLSQQWYQHCHQPFWTKRGGEKGRKGWTERSSTTQHIVNYLTMVYTARWNHWWLLADTGNNRKTIVGLYLLYLSSRPLTPRCFLFNWAAVNTL